jgi:hypothetical protein
MFLDQSTQIPGRGIEQLVSEVTSKISPDTPFLAYLEDPFIHIRKE